MGRTKRTAYSPVVLLGAGILAASTIVALIPFGFRSTPAMSEFVGYIAMDGEWGDGFFGCGDSKVTSYSIMYESDLRQRYSLQRQELGEPLYVEIEGRLVNHPEGTEFPFWVDGSLKNLEIYGYRNLQRNREVVCPDGVTVFSPEWVSSVNGNSK